jgi:hypothetical protein
MTKTEDGTMKTPLKINTGTPPRADVRVENHGSIVLVRPMTGAGRDWIEANVATDGGLFDFGGALVVEPRYVANLVDGMIADGLVVV